VDLKILDTLLAAGVKAGASDLHFKVGDKPAFRIDGQLVSVKYDPLSANDTGSICRHLLGNDPAAGNLDELQEHDVSYSVPNAARFRVNIYRQRGTLCCILRVIPQNVPTVEELGLPSVVTRLAEEERGLVLVTGATGSGKSSTLAAMLHHINHTRPAHVLTIEDPIEFLHSNRRASFSQREIGPDTRSFTTALRSALRQDPDVILVGEMRDPETIDIALKAAETGHMVFSTVHTTDVAKTIGRIVGVFPAEQQHAVRSRLAENLKGVISQRLAPCADQKGRVVAAEILVATNTIRDAISDPEKTSRITDLLERGWDQYGMQSFDQHLSRLYRAGKITLDAAKATSTSPSDFERALAFDDAPVGSDDAGFDESEEEDVIELV
jgi:twitching motility protein PilT